MSFYAKLLLFGEFTLINGSSGLAIPFPFYSGHWAYSDIPQPYQEDLKNLYTYIATHEELKNIIQLDKLKHDLDNGLYFKSTIPNGYGLGSSGALCAAVLSEFVTKNPSFLNNKKDKILALRKIFIALESFFHGSSSGIDPLICYLNEPILIKNKNEIVTTSLPVKPTEEPFTIFLLNTQQPRSTATTVNWFIKQCENPAYFEKTQILSNHTNKAVYAFLNTDFKETLQQVKQLSRLQFQYFQPMITPRFMPLWEKSLTHSIFNLKVCGAGGGGFILGFTHDWEDTQKALQDFELLKVF